MPNENGNLQKHQAEFEDTLQIARRREASNRVFEMYVWMIASIVIAGRIALEGMARTAPLPDVIASRYLELLLALGVFFFPVVFRLIFGAMPLEAIRRTRAQRQVENSEQPSESRPVVEVRRAELQVLTDAMGTDELASSSATKLFAYFATNSRRLSQSIYNRAGVYLMVGVVVAFSGLAFFYLQTAQSAPLTQPGDGLSILISLAPKFGILFFIELVAFFFLRQYRSAMDEFRYYEAIKRNREETLALIRIALDSGKEFDPLSLVKSESFFSKAGVLDKGQSTEIIESRKLEKSEIELLEKVLDVVSRSKK